MIAKHHVAATPEDLVEVASRSVNSKLSRLVREHHQKYDAAVQLPPDSAEGVLRSWLESDEAPF